MSETNWGIPKFKSVNRMFFFFQNVLKLGTGMLTPDLYKKYFLKKQNKTKKRFSAYNCFIKSLAP